MVRVHLAAECDINRQLHASTCALHYIGEGGGCGCGDVDLDANIITL